MARVTPAERSDRTLGCLLAGGIGDALGAPVEFLSLDDIHVRIGPDGVSGPLGHRSRGVGAVTDDTQMTLFTAEGLIRAAIHGADPVAATWRSYLRWLGTQGAAWPDLGHLVGSDEPDGWLWAVRELHDQRAPGNTCLGALATGTMGAIPADGVPSGSTLRTAAGGINRSKGCGGIMRAAPCGLIAAGPERAFALGAAISAITHGHPEGYLPGGVLAAVVDRGLAGAGLSSALATAVDVLATWPHHEPTLAAIDAARGVAAAGPVDGTALEALGGAWVGEEALAIALAAALSHEDPVAGLLASVNHGGDSDSTGAIAGNLLGAVHGTAWLPPRWVEVLEVRAALERAAHDLAAVAVAGGGRPAIDLDGYPTP